MTSSPPCPLSPGPQPRLSVATEAFLEGPIAADQYPSVEETISLTTTCKQCNEIFTDPRLLPCLHSFCKECISGLIKTIESNKMICCHMCYDTTPLPAQGTKVIPPNLHLEHEAHVATYEGLIMKKIPPPCGECSRDPAFQTVSFCCTCASFLCQECHAQHRLSRKALLNHKTIVLKNATLTDIRTTLRDYLTFPPIYCTTHAKEEIKLHCIPCNVMLCMQCALTQHSGHAMDDLSAYVKQEKDSIEKVVSGFPDMISKLDDLINSGEIVCESIKSREESIEEKINTIFSELQKSLEERKASLLDQCSTLAASKVSSLTVQLDALTSLKDAITTCAVFARSSSNNYSELEFLAIISSLHARVLELEEKVKGTSLQLNEDDTIHFNVDTTDVKNSISHLGSIHATNLIDPIFTVKTSNAYHVAIHINGDLIVANHIGDTVEVYSTTGSKKSSFGKQGHKSGHQHSLGYFRRPLGVAVTGDTVYVSEFNGSRCQKMTISGEFLCEVGAGLLKGAWGCTVSKNGTLYVAEEANNRVQAFNSEGGSLKIVCSSPLIHSPRDVAIDDDGNIHVATCGLKCVKVFDPNGVFIRDYGESASIMEPSGVAIDQLGICYVADWGGKSLHIFDPTGRYLHKIDYDGCISGVAIDNNNHIYVVNHSSQFVYKY